MKIKMGFLLLAGALIALAAWLVHVPDPIQAVEVPEKYRDTVAKGLDFLAKHQAKDGHWEGDDGKHPVAMTALVGVALLMDRSGGWGERGRSPLRVGKYSNNIKQAADWLVQQSKAERDGLFFSEHASETPRYMEGHGLATMLLAGALRYENDKDREKRLSEVLTKAVSYIARSQSSQGGWYHTSRLEGHDFDAVLPTVIQIQALQAAEHVGIAISERALAHGQEYLKRAAEKYEKAKEPHARNGRLSDAVAATACRYSTIHTETDVLQRRGLDFCAKEWAPTRKIEFGADELNHLFCAQALFVGGYKWTDYRNAVFEQLKSAQNNDGSWPGSVGIGGGPVYSTAIWCIVLQLDNAHHPAMREIVIRK